LNGFILVHKPSGPTSFDVVRHVQRCLHIKKAGHAGTLDPLASGLLIVAIGSATRLLEFLPVEPKVYDFGIQFGVETDTLDAEGVIVNTGGRIPEETEIVEALVRLSGTSMQLPPRYSAKKIQGERAYDLARKNIEFTLQPKEITLDNLVLNNFDKKAGEARCSASCSTGTYVRALVRDIAAQLSTYAYASYISRIAAGSFTLNDAVTLSELNGVTVIPYIISIKKMFASSIASVVINEQQQQMISHGTSIPLSCSTVENEPVMAYNQENELVAILKKDNEGLFHPDKVFIASRDRA
jgi:tRNA pseudouridine55 synthase